MKFFKKFFGSKEPILVERAFYALSFKKETSGKSLFDKKDPIKGHFYGGKKFATNTALEAVFVGEFPLHHVAALWEENGEWIDTHFNAVNGAETMWVFYDVKEDDYFVLLDKNLGDVEFRRLNSSLSINLDKLDPSVIDARTAEAAKKRLSFLNEDCKNNPQNYSFHNEWFPFLTKEARDETIFVSSKVW